VDRSYEFASYEIIVYAPGAAPAPVYYGEVEADMRSHLDSIEGVLVATRATGHLEIKHGFMSRWITHADGGRIESPRRAPEASK
jgi:hypothetical protein